MSGAFTESIVEQTALAWLESLGWRVTHGLDIAAHELGIGTAARFTAKVYV